MADLPELWVERTIREAAEKGVFDNLDGSGKPIPDIDEPYDAEWWVRRWIRRNRDTEAAEELGAALKQLQWHTDG